MSHRREIVHLTHTEFQLFFRLAESHGDPVGKHELEIFQLRPLGEEQLDRDLVQFEDVRLSRRAKESHSNAGRARA